MADGNDEHALLLQIAYDLNRLQKQGNQAAGVVDKSLTDIERRAKKTALQLEEAFSLKGLKTANIEAALGGIVNQGRIGLIDKAGESVAGLGGALEGLGVVGLGAAAGIAALGAVFEETAKTAEWAEQLKKAAQTLGLTTTQLQEFDFAFNAVGIDVEKGREALAGLEKTIGAVKDGLARAASIKSFQLLGITPEQLRSWGTLDQQLPHILDALGKLDAEGRAGVASRLKVDPEVLNSLVAEREEFNKAIDTFKEYGLVIGPDVIDQSAEAAGQMRATSAIIQGELRKAFIDLSPAIVAAAKWLADTARDFGDFIGGVKEASKQVAGFIGWVDQAVPWLGQLDTWAKNATGALGGLWTMLNHIINPLSIVVDLLKQLGHQTNQARAAGVEAGDAAAAAFPVKQGPHLDPTPKHHRAGGKAAPADRTAAETTTVNEDVDRAEKALAEALKALTTDIDERARFEREAIQDETKAELEKLEAERRKILDDKTIDGAHARVLDASLVKAEADVRSAEAAKVEAISRQLSVDHLKQDEATRAVTAQGQLDALHAQEGLWQTTEKRRALALQVFDLEEKNAEAVLKAQIAQAQIAKNKQDEARLSAQLANMQATAGDRREAVSQANPGNSWDAWLADAKHSVADVGEAFAKMKVDGVEAFNQSLFNSEGRLNSLGSIARSVAQKMITDFEQFALKSAESSLFGGGGGGAGGAGGGAGGGLAGLFGGGGQAGGGIGALFSKLVGGGGVTQPGAAGAAAGNSAGGLLGGLFGGATGGKPDGSATNPFFVQMAPGLGGGSGGLASLFGGGGAGGAGGGLGGFSSLMSLIPGFAGGGQLTVGGTGGVDRNLAMMRLSRGERVTIETPQQQRERQAGGIGQVSQTFNFPGANPDGFRRSHRQWARTSRMAMQYGSF